VALTAVETANQNKSCRGWWGGEITDHDKQGIVSRVEVEVSL